MTQSLYLVAGFILLLALVPFGVRWLQNRFGGGSLATGSSGKVLSAVAVGPHQRVVTVEVGASGARICLVLGVTQQAITCLHVFPAGADAAVPMRQQTVTVGAGVAGT